MKIAILRRNGLGDLICTQPLIKYLQYRFPTAKIHLFIESNNKELADYLCPEVTTHTIPKGNKYITTLGAALKWRKLHFDIAISAKPTPMKLNNLFLWLLGAKKRYAVTQSHQWHEKLINYSTCPQYIKGHHQSLKILKTFCPEINELSSDLLPKISSQYFLSVKQYGFPTILFSVSNNRKSSCITHERMALIAQQIRNYFPDVKFIISTLRHDRSNAEKLSTMIGDRTQIVECQSLQSFLSLLSSTDLIIVGDGGICHLAAALNKKLVALYGVTKPENWAPLASENQCVTLYDRQNVNNIPLEDIYQAIFKLLSSEKMHLLFESNK
ncbi:glycosyltransferase family 9 protein [Photorhabdus luminescens]|uniref:Lipopolysaccharide heptosyltransferase family protein n=1 Tax=Photorhabdus luminescens subsp. sonorensis TaxID=1173677 RepID=A0A5C4REL3_PHOLU|nr:glycosyltransferase family 9 protein [Photorhabdus luminescens]TNH42228.1 lipopolysaccharide heptosyltransferase family protein [Photorhabdus luminescens subsp. sonorensis]